MKNLIVFALLFQTISEIASAQVNNQSLYWVRYQLQLEISPKLSWFNDVDNRRFFKPDVQNQLIFHSRIHYKINRWDLAGGLTYSIAYAAIPREGFKTGVAELRPVVEASYDIPVGNGSLSQRIRMDNRVFQQDVDENLFDDSYYVMRLRYRLQYRFPLRRNEHNLTTIGLRLADEIMINDRKNLFDQNRIYVSADFRINSLFTFEAGYINIYQRRFKTDEYFARNVLRFSVIHRITPKD